MSSHNPWFRSAGLVNPARQRQELVFDGIGLARQCMKRQS
jgi:hypothetical protein